VGSAHVLANPERGYFTRLFIILPKKPFFVFSSHLTRVGRLAISREDEESVIEVIENFENFAKSTAGKGLEGVTEQAARSLGEVGEAALPKKDLKEATTHAVISLEEVGRTAAEKGLERVTSKAAESLVKVGRAAAAEEGLELATKHAAWSLAELTISSEELVKTAIRDYQSELEEKDRIAFQKFMKIYEQKLEELRAGKSTQNKKTTCK